MIKKNCMNTKKFYKKNIWYIKESIYALKKYCPRAFFYLIIGELILVFFPILLLYANEYLIYSITVLSSFSCLFIATISFVTILLFQNLAANYFRKYIITFNLLPQFEKEIKLHLFEIYSRFKVDDFDDAELNNESIRAKNASINLFRIAQISIEIIFSIICVFSINNLIGKINSKLWLIMIFITISTILEKIISIINTAEFINNKTQTTKEYDEYRKYLITPSVLNEIINFDSFTYFFYRVKAYLKKLEIEEVVKENKNFLFSFTLNIISAFLKTFGYYYLFKLFLLKTISLIDFSIIISSFSMIDSYFSTIFSEFSMITQFCVLTKPYFEYKEKSDVYSEKKSIILNSDKIYLKNIYYKYKNKNDYALKNITFEINENEKIAIVGENGSGKSTLGKLILQQIMPSSGNIYINNTKLEENLYFSNLSVVPQDFNIYSVSIKDNITFGEAHTDAYITKKIQNIGLRIDSKDIYKIYGKEFGGISLSYGQTQRLIILRGVLKKSKLIVLDEPSSALDSIEETKLFSNFFPNYPTKTIIFITHNLSLIKYADKIIVMKNGTIVESGCYKELMNNNGAFKKMWETQKNLNHS